MMAKVLGTVQKQVAEALGYDPESAPEAVPDWDALMEALEVQRDAMGHLRQIQQSLSRIPSFAGGTTLSAILTLINKYEERESWAVLGCGDGSGKSFVYGPHEAIKRCQEAMLAEGKLQQDLDLVRLRLAALLDVGKPGEPLETLPTLLNALTNRLALNGEHCEELEGVEKALSEFRQADDDTPVVLVKHALEALRRSQADFQASQDELAMLRLTRDDLTRRVLDLQQGQKIALDQQVLKDLSRLEGELKGTREKLVIECENRARLQGYVDRVLEQDYPVQPEPPVTRGEPRGPQLVADTIRRY
jgi:hypothetical protein